MFQRIGNLIKGFFGLFIGGIEKKNPQALLEVEKENLRTQIANFNKGLANHAALVERLISHVKKLDLQENELRAKTTAFLKAEQRELAGKTALQLKEVETEHDQVKVQLEEADTRYKELVNARDVSVRAARTKLENLRRGIDDMKVQKAVAELNEMASGMIGEIGGSGDNLNRLGEIVEEERTKAAGRARVAKDSLDLGEIEMKEAQQEVLAEMALADFAAQEGIALQNEEGIKAKREEGGSSTTQATMGPLSD